VENPALLPRARRPVVVCAKKAGVVRDMDPYALGMLALALGAGRTRADQAVDPKAGIELLVGLGTRVEPGDPLCSLHTSRPGTAGALVERTRAAFSIGAKPRLKPLLVERLG